MKLAGEGFQGSSPPLIQTEEGVKAKMEEMLAEHRESDRPPAKIAS
jgi:hypothetical protein